LNYYYLNLELLLSNCYCLDIGLLLSNFLSLALGQTPKCWFSFLFLRQQSKLSRSSPLPFLYTKSAIKKKKIQEHIFFLCIYCVKIKNSTRTLPYDFMFNNSKGCKNRNFCLIYVAETNQEKIKKQKTQIERYNLWLDLL